MEDHETTTKFNVSVAFKLTIARFVVSTIVQVAVNRNALFWFGSGGLAYDA